MQLLTFMCGLISFQQMHTTGNITGNITIVVAKVLCMEFKLF